MSTIGRWCSRIFLFVIGVLLPAAAMAQSVIAGQVKDNTGGVLPGVTVVASSPVLIEGQRTVVTDGEGRYSIVNLRPGLYRVQFSLEGFSAVVREDLEVPADFTATVNVALSVGAVQETLTVTGASPIVDVQQTESTQVLNREVLDSLPTGRSVWSNASLVAGVRMAAPDVGGSQSVDDVKLTVHGASGAHTVYQIDGMQVNTLISNGLENTYFQDGANQEISFQTSGGTAEAQAGGLLLNMVPKDGGNTFSGALFVGGSNGDWQSDNFSQDLKDQGVMAVNRIAKVWDVNGSVGGPLMRNKLWFFTAERYWGSHNPVADTFFDDGSQGINDASIRSFLVRLTGQPSARDKVSAYIDRTYKGIGHTMAAGTDPETGSTRQPSSTPYYVAQGKWTSAFSNRLMTEAGISTTVTNYHLLPQPGIEAAFGSTDWYTRVRKQDLDRGTAWNGQTQTYGYPLRYVLAGSLSYVTGSHNLKVGAQDSWGTYELRYDTNGHLIQQYRSGAPNTVVVRNYPVDLKNRLNHDFGLYVQDSWRVNRLTINPGVRFDWLNSRAEVTNVGGGRFVGPRSFEEINDVPSWFDVSPRLGVAYDVFGDGRTAVKFSAGKYLTPHTTGFAEQFNPMALVSATIPWTDRDLQGRSLPTNGDDIAQDTEIDLTRLPTNFGVRQLGRFDPAIDRENNLETSVGVQHEVARNVAVSAAWYRRSFRNIFETYNTSWSASSYVPVTIVSPYDAERIVVYNLNDVSQLNRVENLTTNSDNSQIYNGFEFAGQMRLPQGGVLTGSSTTQRTRTNTCGRPDDPNFLRFCDQSNLPSEYGVPFLTDFKISGTYPFPMGIRVSGSFQSNAGLGLPISYLISPTTRYTAAQCAGGGCTPNALVIPGMVQPSLTVPLVPTGAERFFPRLNQLDLGVQKTFRVGVAQLQAQFDVFNLLNSDTHYAERSANFGTAAYGIPSTIIQGRLPRVAMQLKW